MPSTWLRVETSWPMEPSRRQKFARGDPCPNCGGALTLARGIEIGHIFQLGRKYAEALDLKVLDENGKRVVVTMGSYGIGVSRAVAAVAEQSHDDKGLIWPRSISPADVHIVATSRMTLSTRQPENWRRILRRADCVCFMTIAGLPRLE